jgi:Lrp/AsnC family leucine-responsive transcriptional regulator
VRRGILRGLPEIVECDRITGDDCFIAKAHVRSVEHLEKIIGGIMAYAMTNTSIIQSSPVERRLPTIGG